MLTQDQRIMLLLGIMTFGLIVVHFYVEHVTTHRHRRKAAC